jgi:oligo-1,6-glucosidase
MPPSWGHEEYKDVATKNYWRKVYEERKKEMEGRGEKGEPEMGDVLKDLRLKARDNARTPVQVRMLPLSSGSSSSSSHS